MANAVSVCDKNILSPETERGAGTRVLPSTPKVAVEAELPASFQKIIADSSKKAKTAKTLDLDTAAKEADVEMDVGPRVLTFEST